MLAQTDPSGEAAAAAGEAPRSGDLRFALLNDAFATDGASINVAAGIDCSTCIELVFVASADAREAASYPRIQMHVGPGARIGLIERHVSLLSERRRRQSSPVGEREQDAAPSGLRPS